MLGKSHSGTLVVGSSRISASVESANAFSIYAIPVPENIDSLGQDHPVVIFRKQHLGRYLTRLVTGALEMAKWLNTWIS